MSKRFVQLTSGWILVTLALLLATVLISGQAGAAEPPQSRVPPTVSIPDENDHAHLASIRHFVDTELSMPKRVQVTIDVSVYPVSEDMPATTDRLG